MDIINRTVEFSMFDTIISIIDSIINFMSYKLGKKVNKPKLIITHKMRFGKIDEIKDDVYFKNREKFEHNKTGGGFPCIRYKENKISYLEIKNNSEYPVKNLKVNIYVDLKKVVIKRNFLGNKSYDNVECKDTKIKKYNSVNIKKNITYIPPGGEIKIDLFMYNGQFIEFDIRVKKIATKEGKAIEKNTILDIVKHEEFTFDNVKKEVYGLKELSENRDDIKYKSIKRKDDRIYFFYN